MGSFLLPVVLLAKVEGNLQMFLCYALVSHDEHREGWKKVEISAHGCCYLDTARNTAGSLCFSLYTLLFPLDALVGLSVSLDLALSFTWQATPTLEMFLLDGRQEGLVASCFFVSIQQPAHSYF